MVTIRFYEELNDFLVVEKKKVSFTVKTNPGQTVKDLIESENVPHTEVDLILVNSNSVDFSYQVKANDRISVYPVFESLDIKNATKLRPLPLR
ncbi:MAG: MoaD/ThiS family protein, partial [Spirochaetales bacterium]|nr:MoaD/ThiS family protein [Spirochaetales bacterium]